MTTTITVEIKATPKGMRTLTVSTKRDDATPFERMRAVDDGTGGAVRDVASFAYDLIQTAAQFP